MSAASIWPTTVVCDTTIQDYFDNLTDSRRSFQTGLLLGQFVQKKAVVWGVIGTPPEGEDLEGGSIDWKGRKWIFGHAELVAKMSVGGVGVVGAFVYAHRENLSEMEAKGHISTLAFGLPTTISTPGSPRILLTIPMSRQINCRVFAGSEDLRGSPGSKLTAKFQKISDRIVELRARVPISSSFTFTSDKKTGEWISRCLRDISSSLTLINGSQLIEENLSKDCDKVSYP
ncbi:hypothetical protein AAMO2058_001247600 [Amorphochlora amoebiformis]